MIPVLRKNKTELLIFLAIVFIAVFFRFYDMSSTPPGLWVDEAMNGTDAQTTLHTGNYKVFYPDNNGREGLYINLQALSIKLFGNEPWTLRIVSAVIGVLTVIGLYLLTRYLFGWETAAIASFIMAVMFWHVNFSRIGFRAIMTPFILVFLFYFLWRGLRKSHMTDFIIAGIFTGLGFYTYIAYRITPFIILAVFLNYWLYIKTDFDITIYKESKNRIFKGFLFLVITSLIVVLPIVFFVAQNPDMFFGREGQLSVFSTENPIKELANSVIKTLGMFTFTGDWNQRHNIPGDPVLAWPIGIFFAIGFIKELIHWLKRKHGHFSTVHTFLFSWFFVMLLPGFLSTEAPHALRTIGVIPVVAIFTAQGLWWSLTKLERWHALADPESKADIHAFRHDSKALMSLAIIIFLGSIGIWEYFRYFKVWAPNIDTGPAFSEDMTNIGYYLRNNPPQNPTFVLANHDGVLVDKVSVFVQPIKFLTGTYTKNLANNKNIYYITNEQLLELFLPANATVIPLVNDEETKFLLINRFGLREKIENGIAIYSK